MPTLNDFLPDVLGRIEESDPPIFWNLQGEVFVKMVYSMFEAAVVTGNVQQSSIVVNLTAGFTYFNIQGPSNGYNSGGYGSGTYGGNLVPQGLIAPIRMKAPYPVRKTTLKSLDDLNPNWQQAAPAAQIQAWFPVGVNLFGIYPQLSVDTEVVMDFLASPVNKYRPYDGTETSPFQHEFNDLITKYSATMLRAKEGGAEAEEADVVYREYMETLKDLSLFQQRVDSLVFSRALGAKVGVNPKTQA